MSSDFTLHSVNTPPPVQAPPPAQPPKPPKSQSDHKPVNEATTSRGPAVVLSGAFAKPPEKPSSHAETASTGQHVNHVI